MKKLVHLFPLLFLLFVVSSCRKDDPPVEKGLYDKGVVIVNEGLFQTGKGTISFLDPEKDTVYQEVYETANSGLILGNIAQSYHTSGSSGYVVVNNSGKVVVVNGLDFTYRTEWTGLRQPRYLTFTHGKAWITCWGDGVQGEVVAVDTANAATRLEFAGLAGPEDVILEGSKLWVALSGGYGNDKRIIVIDPALNTVSDTLEVGDVPRQFVRDGQGNLYVLCSGYFDWTNPANSTSGGLWSLQNGTSQHVVDLPNGVKAINYDGAGHFYFLSGNQLGSMNVASKAIQYATLDLITPYQMIYLPEQGQLLIGDAVDYSSQGEVVLADKDGTIRKRYKAGIIPGFFRQR